MEQLLSDIALYIRAYQTSPCGREVVGTVELLQEVSEKLKEYRDLEEQGLFRKFPCTVGDTVYNLLPIRENRYTYREDIVDEILIKTDRIEVKFKTGLSKNVEQFGKTVFLTQAEAEEVIEEKR